VQVVVWSCVFDSMCCIYIYICIRISCYVFVLGLGLGRLLGVHFTLVYEKMQHVESTNCILV